LRTKGAKETTKKAEDVPSGGAIQVMTFKDKIPPQFEYKPISLLEREALTQVNYHILMRREKREKREDREEEKRGKKSGRSSTYGAIQVKQFVTILLLVTIILLYIFFFW
jgi:hypothetical protein